MSTTGVTGRIPPPARFVIGGNSRHVKLAAAVGFIVILTQRIGINTSDGGSVQLATIIAAGMLVWLVGAGHVRVSPAGLALWLLMTAAAALSALASESFSVAALLLFIVTYVLVIISRSQQDSALGTAFFLGMVRGIKLGALLGVMQWVLQKAGFGFLDPFGALPSWMLRSGFNTYYDLQFSGGRAGEYKPNGVLFLEPSFLSLFTAIALIFCMHEMLRQRQSRKVLLDWFWIAVLAVALAVSASASGVVVIAAAALPLLVRSRKHFGYALVLLLVALVAVQSGIFDAVLNKTQEDVLNPNTSAALRLVLPYELLTPYWLQSPFVGLGPGAASDAINELGRAGLQASTTMKLLVEYGLVGATILTAIVIRAIWRTRAPGALLAAIVAAWLIPAEALVNSTLVTLLVFVLPQWGERDVAATDAQAFGNPPGDSAG